MDRRTFLTTAGALATLASLPARASSAQFDPAEHSLADLQKALTEGAITSEALVAAYLSRIERFDQPATGYRSVLAVNPLALDAARQLDGERRAGKLRGVLHGLPILIKDNIETLDPMPTTAGSWALRQALATADAPLVARLRSAGAIVLGKTNLSEWANFRSSRSTSGWSGLGGQTCNAYDLSRNPSGSSSGSAVAAAASFCAGAIGTETDGSILSPSAYNGLVGLKPTVGQVSGQGIVPLSPRQDTAGPMCRTVADAALLAMPMGDRALGYGPQGSDLHGFRLAGLRIGMMKPSRGIHPGTLKIFEEACRVFRSEGAVLVELDEPASLHALDEPETTALLYEFKSAINRYLSGLDPAKVSARSLADLIKFNATHEAEEMPDFGQELFEQAEACGPLTEARYLKAVAALKRGADIEGLQALLSRHAVQVLLAHGNAPAEVRDPLWGDRGGSWPSIASAAAVAGYPSLTVPAGMVRGLPVGIVLVGSRFKDGLLLQVGHAFERAARARVAPRLVG